jgi:hypothetical protein
MVEVDQVEHEVLHPQRRALADRRRLCRLEVRRSKRGLGAPFSRERRQRAEHTQNLAAKQFHAPAHENQVRVVRDVGARCPVVDEAARRGSNVAERMDVRHHVMPKPTLVGRDHIEIDVVEVRPHLRDRLVGNRNTELLFRFGEREPQLPPQTMSLCRRPELQHRFRCVSLGERRRVAAGRRHRTANSVTYNCPCRSTATRR